MDTTFLQKNVNQGSERPGQPGKLKELANTSGKTWKTQVILSEGSYFDFVKMLVTIRHVFTSFFDLFIILVLIVCIFIFIMQPSLYLKDL